MTVHPGGGAPLDWRLVGGLVAVGLFLSAFFSGTETGYMSVSRVRLHRSGQARSKRGRRLLAQLQALEDPILTCLIGTNLCNVLVSALVTMALTQRFGPRGEWLALLVISTLVILLGEIIPKILYREAPERMTLASVPALSLAMALLAPVRWLLRGYSALWRRLLPGGEGDFGPALDRRSLAALLLSNKVPAEEDPRFAVSLDRYLQLASHRLGSILQPLDRLVTVGPRATVAQCLKVAARSGFSRLPVAPEDGRRLRRYVLVRDLLFLSRQEHGSPVPTHLQRPFLLVDERMTPYELFEELRGQGRQLALVVDAAGNPLGMITLEDLIEAVIGSVRDEFDNLALAVAAAGEWTSDDDDDEEES